MIMRQEGGRFEIHFEPSEFARWKRLLDAFKPRMEHKLGWWRTAPNVKLWSTFICEFLVRGGTGPLDRARGDKKKWRRLLRETSLTASLAAPSTQLAEALNGATRFPNVQAKAIERCRRDEKIVRQDKFVLLKGFESIENDTERRNEIRRRCSAFGLKGASNFLINVGAAQDLAAIDSRIGACLKSHFGFPFSAQCVQSSDDLYEAVESALREVATRNHVSLAHLDRSIFQASGKNALEPLLSSKASNRRAAEV